LGVFLGDLSLLFLSFSSKIIGLPNSIQVISESIYSKNHSFETKLERASNFMVLLYSYYYYYYVSFYLFQFFVCFIVGLFDFCRQILSLNTKAQLLVV